MPYVWECTDIQVSKALASFEKSKQLPKDRVLRCKDAEKRVSDQFSCLQIKQRALALRISLIPPILQ